MKPYKILIIEDDPVIQSELETLLRGNGYTAVSVKDFSKVTDTFKAEEPHLILLDIKLPNESGFSICSKIRSISNAPIIFVTSCNTDMDELNSIMLGGDAFITKPYNTAILLAKIAALLRRVYASEQSEILTWNDATLHLESSMIEYKGQKAELTKNELKILYYLFKSAGKICSRNDMVDFLWDNQLYIDDNALSVNITRIRNKLDHIVCTTSLKQNTGRDIHYERQTISEKSTARAPAEPFGGIGTCTIFDRHRDLPPSHFLDRFGLDCGCSLLSDGLFFHTKKTL